MYYLCFSISLKHIHKGIFWYERAVTDYSIGAVGKPVPTGSKSFRGLATIVAIKIVPQAKLLALSKSNLLKLKATDIS